MAITVLIVDDHAGFRSWARELLEREGLVVVGEAADGAAGLQAARVMGPDLVLLDVRLPDHNGFDVARELAAAEGAPAIVLTSSHDPRDYRRRLAASPARGFLPKAELSRSALERLLHRDPP